MGDGNRERRATLDGLVTEGAFWSDLKEPERRIFQAVEQQMQRPG